MPVDVVNRVVPRLIAFGRYARPTLGLRVEQQINAALAARFGIEGLFVLEVEPGSAGERAGIRPARFTREGEFLVGDIITAIADRPMGRVADLLNALDSLEPGQEVTVVLLRDGRRTQLRITPGTEG